MWIYSTGEHGWGFLQRNPWSWRPVFGAFGWPAGSPGQGARADGETTGQNLCTKDTHLGTFVGVGKPWFAQEMSCLYLTCIKIATGLSSFLTKIISPPPFGWYLATHLGKSTQRKTWRRRRSHPPPFAQAVSLLGSLAVGEDLCDENEIFDILCRIEMP